MTQQYVFEMVKGSSKYNVRCTAKHEEWARAAVTLSYSSDFTIGKVIEVNPAHYYLGEIDASGTNQADYDWTLVQIKNRGA